MSIDNRHMIDLPFWARPGFSTMAKDDDQGGGSDDDEQDDDEDEEDDEDDDPDAGKSDEELRAELKSVRDSLAKANGQSKSRRLQLKQREAELAEARKPKKPKADDDDEGVDADAIRAEAKREAKAEADTRTVKAEARGALRGIGVPADQVQAIVGMLDLSDVDVDDDGNVDGVDDAVADLQRRFPQLFPKSRKKASIAGSDDRSGRGAAGKPSPKSASEQQADLILGRTK